MLIDDILDPLKELGQMGEDLMFTSHRSGTMYTYMKFLVFKKGNEEYPIPYPCSVTINGGVNCESTPAISGSDYNPVTVSGFDSYNLTISFEAGDYRISLADRIIQSTEGGVIRANDVLKRLALLIRNQDGNSSVEIIQGAIVKDVPQVTQKFFGQTPVFENNPSLLHDLEIKMVVIKSMSITPVANHRYQVSLSCVCVGSDEAARKLFMTLKEYEIFKKREEGV